LSQLLDRLHEYWARRASTYDVPDVFGRQILNSYIMKLKPQTLVEVGCGHGELFSIYRNVARVVGLDWSDEMLQRSRSRIERHGYGNVSLKHLDITKESLAERFDVALTRTCLMHIPPEGIVDACVNVASMSNQLLVFEYYNPDRRIELAPHNWHHEYPYLFTKLGFKMVEAYDRPDGLPQILFHFKRNMA